MTVSVMVLSIVGGMGDGYRALHSIVNPVGSGMHATWCRGGHQILYNTCLAQTPERTGIFSSKSVLYCIIYPNL
jgi:hypothetical protein